MVERETQRRQREIGGIRLKETGEFPEDPEKRFEAVFAAIGNSEAKCLTLLCLSESPITSCDLHQKFLEASGGVWKSSRNLQADYCLGVLIPIGLMAEADIVYYGFNKQATSFRLTEAGLRYSQPIAAFLLEKSSQLPSSLLEIFGPTTKGPGETRAVLNRAKILEFLTNSPANQRRIDIARNCGLAEGLVGKHLEYLASARLGLVAYSSVNLEEKGQFKYQLVPGAQKEEVQKVLTYPKLTTEVADLLFQQTRVDSSSLAEHLKDKYPRKSMGSLTCNIGNIISGLEKQGICQREVFKAREIQSQARITQPGEALVSQIILPLKEALKDNQTLLSVWRAIPWLNYAKGAIAKYKEASGYARRRPLEKGAGEAYTYICQHPGERRKTIKAGIGRSPDDLLRALLETGKIRREREGKAIRYYSQ